MCSCTVQCAVKYGETEAEGCLVGIESDTLIRMVALMWILVPDPRKAGLDTLVVDFGASALSELDCNF